MNFIKDFKNDEKAGSHELGKENKPKRKLKPRFSVNLSDSDYEKVKEIRQWLVEHPQKADLRAYLFAEDPYSARK